VGCFDGQVAIDDAADVVLPEYAGGDGHVDSKAAGEADGDRRAAREIY
jgi:hypothetical protein